MEGDWARKLGLRTVFAGGAAGRCKGMGISPVRDIVRLVIARDMC